MSLVHSFLRLFLDAMASASCINESVSESFSIFLFPITSTELASLFSTSAGGRGVFSLLAEPERTGRGADATSVVQ